MIRQPLPPRDLVTASSWPRAQPPSARVAGTRGQMLAATTFVARVRVRNCRDHAIETIRQPDLWFPITLLTDESHAAGFGVSKLQPRRRLSWHILGRG